MKELKRYTMAIVLTAVSSASYAQTCMSLQEVYEQADRQSRQLSVSQTGLKAAAEAVAAAKSALLPTVNLTLSGSYIGDATLMSRGFSTSGTSDVIVAGLGPQPVANGRQDTPHWGNTFAAQASQVVYAGGAIKAGIKLAELGEEMAVLDVEKNRQEVRFLLTGYYLDLCKLHNQLAVMAQNIGLTEKLIDHMRVRHEQGTVLRNDITRYELQLENLRLTEVKLQEAVAVINHQLQTTLHLAEGTVIVPDTAALRAEISRLNAVASHDAWLQKAFDGNIGLRQAGVAANMAEQQVKTATAASLPSVALVAEERLFGPFTNDLIPVDANVNTWFVGIGLKYSLSSLWTNKHAVSRARISARQSREQVELVRERVASEVQASYVSFLTAFTEVSTQEKQLELARQNYDVVQNRYRNELALLTDMVDASNMLLKADMALVDARISLLYHYYKLRYAASFL